MSFPTRNPNVPENFVTMYGYFLKEKLKGEHRQPTDGEKVLTQVIKREDLQDFNNQKYTRLMHDVAKTHDKTDEELTEFISQLKGWSQKTVAKEWERKLKARQSLGDEWQKKFEDYRAKETRLYRAWCTEMRSRGLEDSIINTELLGHSRTRETKAIPMSIPMYHRIEANYAID